MHIGKGVVACALGALVFVGMPDLASAGQQGCPPGLAKKGWCEKYPHYSGSHWTRRDDADGNYRYRRDDDRERALLRQDRLDDIYEEGYRDGRRDALRIGERLNSDRYRVLDRSLYYDRYGRRLDDGYYYAEADGQRLLVDIATGAIIDLLSR